MTFHDAIRALCAIVISQVLTLPLAAAENVKTVNGVAIANVKTVAGVANANIKSLAGLDSTGGGGGGFDTTGLMLWADFTGDLVNDANPGTNDGTGINTPTYVTDPFSNASSAVLCEGGSTDRSVSFADAASLEPTGDFSIVMWVRTNGTPDAVVSKYSTAPNLSFSVVWQGGANDRFSIRYSDDGTTTEVETTGANFPDDDSWIHVAFVFDESADQMLIYKNGNTTPVDTETWSTETGAWLDGTAAWRVGCWVDNTSAGNCAVARFSLWSRVLTAQEVNDLWDGTTDDEAAEDVRYSTLSSFP